MDGTRAQIFAVAFHYYVTGCKPIATGFLMIFSMCAPSGFKSTSFVSKIDVNPTLQTRLFFPKRQAK